MLPEFPALKSELTKIASVMIRRMVRASDPILAQVKSFTQHEGLNLRYERFQAAPIESGPQRIQVPVELKPEEVPTLVGEQFSARLDGIAKVVVRQEMKHFFDKVERDSKEVGTALDAEGKPLTGAMLLDALSLPQGEFDEDGHSHSQIVIHPDMAPALKRAGEEIENDPALKQRQEEIFERKRNEWRARESNRKLVD